MRAPLSTLPPALLECVLQQLPVHPRQWSIAATTCSELSEAVANLRKLTAEAICDEYRLQTIHEGGALLMMLVDYTGRFRLSVSLLRQRKSKALRLMVAGAPLDWQHTNGSTPLIRAISGSRYSPADFQLAKALIDACAQLDLRDIFGCTALMKSAKQGSSEMTVSLINAGAQLDLRDYTGSTAMIIALIVGTRHGIQSATESALALIDARAQLDIIDHESNTALTYAIRRHHTQVAEALIKGGAQSHLGNQLDQPSHVAY